MSETLHKRMEEVSSGKKNLETLIRKHAQTDGVHSTLIPSLFLIRESEVSESVARVNEISFCLIIQGEKVVWLGEQRFHYGPGHYIVASVELPVTGQIVQASSDLPYLAYKIEFTSVEVLEVMNDANLKPTRDKKAKRAMFVGDVEAPLLDAAIRLGCLLDQPQHITVLAPIFKKELLYWVLQGPHSDSLKQMAVEDSSARRVRTVIEHILANYNQALPVEELARLVNLGVSSLHRQFKEVTAMSPIQFQKQLRLQEARRLLLSESSDIASIAFRVGYESQSQFSREYSRLFGSSPRADIQRMKERYGG
ncbi:AraC family transcriptional regulator [Saccharibacillus sp. CPCC 101409]|uniref:AraC family transcriptional regulator n=1 Tax=Saccharibacillus sp. CPCC 101409 TaxID=3058041 RepID=UPI002670D2BD|nr:AraC family transcriptional regulator [Saccharibacillus sp. CPCC 101409]MDO3412236.1 AraC family transcriptional regulator [Saccharibacillus sp. CPCC 101409]